MAYTTIDDPSEYFHTQLYTGDGGTTQAITNDGNSDLKPDWVWLKQRANDSANRNHMLFDSTRGSTKALSSNTTDAEDTSSGGYLQSFNTDGFTTGNSSVINKNAVTYVAWQWKANGGTTSSNSDGSITSTVQANTDAGFSIVTWTGSGTSNETVGHGLTTAPEAVILKPRTESRNWLIWFDALGDNDKAFLFDSETPADNRFGPNAPTSSVFGLYGNQGNRDGTTFVAYAFHSVKGYSKFGSFKGNNSSDGTFVYLGFKPRWLMVKNTTQSHANHSWIIFDSARETNNEIDTFLEADTTAADVTSGRNEVDFLSNGFKARESYGDFNGGDGHVFVYMAFAEHPFVSSKGVPTTAR